SNSTDFAPGFVLGGGRVALGQLFGRQFLTLPREGADGAQTGDDATAGPHGRLVRPAGGDAGVPFTPPGGVVDDGAGRSVFGVDKGQAGGGALGEGGRNGQGQSGRENKGAHGEVSVRTVRRRPPDRRHGAFSKATVK